MDTEEKIIERLKRGEVLVLRNQVSAYISLDSLDSPDPFLMQHILQPRYGSLDTPKLISEDRYPSLIAALLSLQEPLWQDKDGNPLP